MNKIKKRKTMEKNQWNKKLSNIDNLLARIIKKKEIRQITRNGWNQVTADFAYIKKIIRENYEQLHVNTFGNLDEMEKLSERYKLLNITQKETDNLNSPISIF